MQKIRQLVLSFSITAFALAGLIGCQTGSRLAMFGIGKQEPQVTAKQAPRSAATEDRSAESFQASAVASRLGGTSISHYAPRIEDRSSEDRKRRTASRTGGPQPGGSGSRNH